MPPSDGIIGAVVGERLLSAHVVLDRPVDPFGAVAVAAVVVQVEAVVVQLVPQWVSAQDRLHIHLLAQL